MEEIDINETFSLNFVLIFAFWNMLEATFKHIPCSFYA